VRRLWAIAAVIAALVVVGLIDTVGRSSGADQGGPAPVMPSLAPASALASSWYCAGATGGSGSAADGVLTIANLSPRSETGVIDAVATNGAPRTSTVNVPARSSITVAEDHLASGANLAQTVRLYGGESLVSQTVSGSLGQSTSACSSYTSSQWYFPSGTTANGDQLYMVLYNPTATDVVADLLFATDQGPTAPADYQGVVVPAGQVVVLDIGRHVQGRQAVATTVTARLGRLVAEQLSLRSAAPGGVSLSLGSPSLGSTWYFPVAATSSGVSETYSLFNPTGAPASVTLDIALQTGSAEPLTVTVQPQSEITVDASHETRIPPGVPHSVTASATGAPVVVGRVVAGAAGSAAPGLAETLGARQVLSAWALPPGANDGSSHLSISVQNPGRSPATATVTAVAAGREVEGAQAVVAQPGRLATVAIPAAVAGAHPVFVVRASAGVVVELDSVTAGPPAGSDQRMGMPFG
jgi:hypothetical protein